MDFVVSVACVTLPWDFGVWFVLLVHGVLFGTGLPVVLTVGCTYILHGPLNDIVFCCGLLLLENVGLSLATVLFAVASGRLLVVLYAVLVVLLPQGSLGERHILAVGLAIGLVQPAQSDAFRCVAPVAALLLLGMFWRRISEQNRSMGRFVFSLLAIIIATVLLCGGPIAMVEWGLNKSASLRLEACLLAVVTAVSVTASSFIPLVRESKARDRKWFHLVMIVLIVVPFVMFEDDVRTTESLALGSLFAVCVLLLVELFRVFSGPNNALAKCLNDWFEAWIDEKEQDQELALSHVYLVLGCCAPLLLLHFCGGKQVANAKSARFAGVVAVGIGDAVAAIVGSKWGRIRWSAQNKRTIEGSLAMFATVAMTLFFALHLSVELSVVISASTCLIEALSLHMDNLVLPLMMFVTIVGSSLT